MSVKVLGKASSINVRKVLWTLGEIGTDFEHENWGTGFRSTTSTEFLTLNPNGLVPVLLDDDTALWESNTICRYLAGKYKRQDLLPDDAAMRAAVEQWMDWAATNLNAAWRYSFMAVVRKHPDFTDASEIAKSISEWNRHMRILDQHLGNGQTYMLGETFTLADIVIGLCVNRWVLSPIDHAACTSVMAYYKRLQQRKPFLKHGANGIP